MNESHPSLLEEVSSMAFLKDAWRRINKSNRKSKGLLYGSIKDFEDRLESQLGEISQSLLNGKFRFSKVKGTTIEKKSHNPIGKQKKDVEILIDPLANLRPLRISEIKDRVVQKALAIKIEDLVSKTFKLDNECSYAYQKKKSIEDAILQMGKYYRQGFKIILEADIIKFFDNVNSAELVTKIKTALPDQSINQLLDKALSQELGNKNELQDKKVFERYFENSEGGIPQGNALSPLFANIYLSGFDQRILDEGLKMVRYADDFVIMCKTKEDAKRAFVIAKEELEEKLKLKIHPLETPELKELKVSRIVDPRQHSFAFLSVRFDGNKFWVTEDKFKSILNKLKCLSSISELKRLYPKEEIGLFQALTKVKNLLEGWVAAYYFLDLDQQISELDKAVNIQLVMLFNEFNFTLRQSDLEQISLKGNRRKSWALNSKQRNLIGIPLCSKTLVKARKELASLNDRITELLRYEKLMP